MRRSRVHIMHAFFIIVVLGMGNPATHFREVRLARPMAELECALQAPVVIWQDARVTTLVHGGWRLVMWDCREGGDI